MVGRSFSTMQRILGLGFRVWGLGFRVLMVWGTGVEYGT